MSLLSDEEVDLHLDDLNLNVEERTIDSNVEIVCSNCGADSDYVFFNLAVCLKCLKAANLVVCERCSYLFSGDNNKRHICCYCNFVNKDNDDQSAKVFNTLTNNGN